MLNVNWKKKITKNIPRLKNFNNNVYRFSTVGHGATGALTLTLSVNLLKVNNKISCCSRILDQFMLNKITTILKYNEADGLFLRFAKRYNSIFI